MKFLFQNEHFVLVEKPALMLTVPGRFEKKDDRPVLGRLIQAELRRNVYPVHRLDFEVSGLVLFALTEKAHAVGNSWFEKKKVQKTYEAFCENQIGKTLGPGQVNEALPAIDEQVEWNSKLLRGKKRAYENPTGKPALTLATLREVRADGSLFWQLNPVTGRSHQLRYELYKHCQPILGDTLYGSTLPWKEGIALRAIKISFPQEAHEFGLAPQYSVPSLTSPSGHSTC